MKIKVTIAYAEVEDEYPHWASYNAYVKDVDGEVKTTCDKEEATNFATKEAAMKYIEEKKLHKMEDKYDNSRNLRYYSANTDSYIKEGSIKIVR
jgi:hypothetical protein